MKRRAETGEIDVPPSSGGGLGLFLTQCSQGKWLTVRALMKGGAAERCGKIQIGDRVVAVCGKTVEGLQPSEAVDLILCKQRERIAG